MALSQTSTYIRTYIHTYMHAYICRPSPSEFEWLFHKGVDSEGHDLTKIDLTRKFICMYVHVCIYMYIYAYEVWIQRGMI